MAFQLSSITTRLKFDNESLNDMAVEVRADVPLRTFFDLQLWMSSSDPEQMRNACVLFGDSVLHSWDLEDESGQLPATGEGFLALPLRLAMEVITAWTNEVSSAGNALSPSLNGTSP